MLIAQIVKKKKQKTVVTVEEDEVVVAKFKIIALVLLKNLVS